jgi:hypothetical protein
MALSYFNDDRDSARQGPARHGAVGLGQAWRGVARRGQARPGKARQGESWPYHTLTMIETRQGAALLGRARPGVALQGAARRGEARQGKYNQEVRDIFCLYRRGTMVILAVCPERGSQGTDPQHTRSNEENAHA